MPQYVAYIDLTKAFDLVSREGLFKILPKKEFSPKLPSDIESFHSNIKGIVHYDGNVSEPFDILAPIVFGIFFALLLRYAFGTATVGIYLQIRSD